MDFTEMVRHCVLASDKLPQRNQDNVTSKTTRPVEQTVMTKQKNQLQ